MVCSQHLAWIELSVSCLPSLQLTLPEGTWPRFGHTLTACRMCLGRIHVTEFGGSPKFEYHLGKSDDAHLKLAETTVMEFGEYNTHCTIHCIVCSLMWVQHTGFSRNVLGVGVLLWGDKTNTAHTVHYTVYCMLTDTLYTYHSSRESHCDLNKTIIDVCTDHTCMYKQWNTDRN